MSRHRRWVNWRELWLRLLGWADDTADAYRGRHRVDG